MIQELWIGIVTAPRAQDYLDTTLQSMAIAAGGTTVHFILAPTFVEDYARCKAKYENVPGHHILPPLWPRNADEVRAACPDHRGLELNSSRLLNALCRVGVPWFLACQDDIVLSRRAVDRIAATAAHIEERREIGAVSFYTPYAECQQSPRSLWKYPDNKFYGDLCLLWRRKAAEEFVRDADPGEGHDIDICRWFAQNKAAPKWQLWSHSPCLAQHTGLHSASGKRTEVRVTMGFRGEGHDAMAAPKPW